MPTAKRGRPITRPCRLGDLVRDWTEQITGRVVWSLPRRSDGQRFLMVQILDGARHGQRVWPDGWLPLLDWPPDGDVWETCGDCHRHYRTTVDLQTRSPWCRTCAAEHQADEDRRRADAGETWRDVRWKREDRGRSFRGK